MADDIASLGFSVDTSQLEAAVGSLDALAKASDKVQPSVKATGDSTTLAGTQMQRMAQESDKAKGSVGALDTAVGGISRQMMGMAAGLGFVGQALAAWGPLGLIAAVGLKVISDGLASIREEALRMGDKAIELQRFSQMTGLAVAQIGGLKKAGAEFGVSGDEIASAFGRLTAQLDGTRRASGPLFEEVRRINSGLADELLASNSTSDAVMVLARAYRDTADEAQRAALARAAFGRGGASLGPVLGNIADRGGLPSSNELGIAEDTIRRIAKLRAELAESEKRTANILASIGAVDALERATEWAKVLERGAKALAEMVRQEEGLSLLQRTLANLARIGMAEGESGVSGSQDALKSFQGSLAEVAARQRIASGAGTNLAVDQKAIESWGQLADAMAKSGDAATQSVKSTVELQNAAAAAAAMEKERIGLMGEAATIDEKRVATLTDLTAALLDGKLKEEDYARAINRVNFDTSDKVLVGLQRQLTVLQSMPGEARALATEQARVKDLLEQQETAERATAIAAAERRNNQAQAVTVIREQRLALQDQLPIIMALTEEDKIRAEVAQTYAKALRDAGLSSGGGGKIIDARQAQTPEQGFADNAARSSSQDLAAQTKKNLLAQQFVQYQKEAEAAEAQLVQQEKAAADQITQANASAKQQLQTLEEQYASAAAVTGQEKIQADAQATYNKLIREGVDQIKAEEVAWQQVANATAAATASVEKQTKSLEEQTELIKARKNGTEASVAAEQALNKALAEGASLYAAEALADATRENITASKSSGGGGSSSGGHDTGLYSLDPAEDARIRVQKNFPNLFQNSTLSAPDKSGHVSVVAQPASPIINTFGTPAQKDYAFEQWFAEVTAAHKKDAVEQQAKAINDSIDAAKKQADAANKNTDAVNSLTGAVSNLYQSDPRFSHLGFRATSTTPLDVSTLPAVTSPSVAAGLPSTTTTASTASTATSVSGGGSTGTGPGNYYADRLPEPIFLAEGGVMSARGPLQLNRYRYEMGGIARSPQVAMFGEGDGPEAFVPLTDGAIKVAVRPGSGRGMDAFVPLRSGAIPVALDLPPGIERSGALSDRPTRSGWLTASGAMPLNQYRHEMGGVARSPQLAMFEGDGPADMVALDLHSIERPGGISPRPARPTARASSGGHGVGALLSPVPGITNQSLGITPDQPPRAGHVSTMAVGGGGGQSAVSGGSQDITAHWPSVAVGGGPGPGGGYYNPSDRLVISMGASSGGPVPWGMAHGVGAMATMASSGGPAPVGGGPYTTSTASFAEGGIMSARGPVPMARYQQSSINAFAEGGVMTAHGSLPPKPNNDAFGRTLLAMAEGGVMTDRGQLPLRRYATGGIASSPQLAMYGEGDGPEAFVPLHGGAIPVTMRGSTPVHPARVDNSSGDTIINMGGIHIDGAVDQGTIDDLRGSLYQQAQDIKRSMPQ